MTPIRIALANLPAPSTPGQSVDLACAALRDASAKGAAIVAFPECYVPGYRRVGQAAAAVDPAFLDGAWATIADAAKRARIGVVLGTERAVDGRPVASVVVIGPAGEILGFQDKVQIDPSEEGTYAPGQGRRTFTIGPLTFGVVICHEGWRYPETVRWAVRHGAQVVFHPHFHEPDATSYRPSTFGDPANSFHEGAMRSRAAENTCYFASINIAVDGAPTSSTVVGPDGSVVAWQPYGQPGLLLADLDLSSATGLLALRLKETR